MSLLRCCWILLLLAGCSRLYDQDELMVAARKYMAHGEPKSAVIQLKNVLQRAPGNAQARLLLGQVYLDMGDLPSAEKELRHALAGGNRAEVLPWLGKVLLQLGQYQKVLDELPADEQQPQLLALRGHALLALHRVEEGRATFAQISLRHPGSTPALLGQARLALLDGDRQQALAHLQQAVKLQPDDADAWRMHGDVLRLLGRNYEALVSYQRILQLRPSQVQAHVDLASLHIQSGKLDEARKELVTARQTTSNSLQAIYTLALLEFRENKMSAAQDHLAQVLRAAPDHLPSNLLMGAVLRSRGNYVQAEQHLRKFLDANPGHPYASKLLASVLMSNGAPQQGLELILPLLSSQQQDREMMALAGELYLRLRQFSRSAEYFEQASKLAPDVPMLRAALALSHLGMGDTERAVAELEVAANLDSKSARVGTMLVLSHLRNGQYDKALAAAKRMESQHPDNPMVHNLKGGVLLMQRDRTAARASFERALALDPLFIPALDNLTTMDVQDNKPEQARRRLETVQAKHPANVDLMTALAKVAIGQAQIGVARTWLERAVQASPTALEPSLRLANFYALNHEPGKALTIGQKLLSSYANEPQVVALVAGLQSRNGQGEAALDNWNKLAALRPNSPEVLHQLAGARAGAQDPAGAAQALSKALALYEATYAQRPSAPALLALYGALVQAGKIGQARQLVQQWLSKRPGDLTTRMYFASSLLAQKDYPASTAQFEQVLRQAPKQVLALNNLAWLYQQQRNPRALEYAEQAHQLAPDNPSISDTLGWLLAEQGKFERALPLLKQASTKLQDNHEIRYHYGMALARAGDKAAARVQLEPLLATQDFARRDAVKAALAQ